jgi:hypothetical protein
MIAASVREDALQYIYRDARIQIAWGDDGMVADLNVVLRSE